MKVFLGMTLCLALLACQSKSKKTELPAEVDYLQSKDAGIVLSQGYNRSAVFSSDGDKIFYISRDRVGHKNTQIHEYDLTLQTDRRITFQDGDVFDVIPLNTRQIIYSSNTDEIKENPFAPLTDPKGPRSELYISDLYGSEITRLTHNVGYDGGMIFVPARKMVLFTSTRSGVSGLYWLNLENEKTAPFVVDKEKPQHLPALSRDGKTVYWVEDNAKEKLSSILSANVFGKNIKVFKNFKGSVKSILPVDNNRVIYSWAPEGTDLSQIDMFDDEKGCTQTLFKSKLNFSEPQFSVNNPKLMIFRVSNNDKSQIYRWQMPADLGPCNEQPASDTLKK